MAEYPEFSPAEAKAFRYRAYELAKLCVASDRFRLDADYRKAVLGILAMTVPDQADWLKRVYGG